MPTQHLTTPGQVPKKKDEICVFAQTTFRNQMRRFGIKTDDRRRHMYVIGKTGMGKTTIMENMVLSDIYAGHGVGLVDPHGDFAEKIINHIPSWRMNDVVYLNPADVENPIGFNILEVKTEEQKHLVAAGLMGTFKKIWPDVWSSRMEYILNNTLLALLDYPGSTLLGVNRLLSDKNYRKRVVKHLKDPVIKAFWRDEFANYDERYAKEAVAPIQNKIGQFLSVSIIRNMVAQVKSTIDVRDIMDSKKIFIMNLSKGRIGEDNSRLLGGMLITKLQLSAMERVDTPEADRKDFFLYVDEFQNFATPSFANILSEARKYRLSLIMAHQYVAQLDEVVANAVFGNVGTIVTFRIGGADAEMLVKEFTPTFTEEDIVNLTKYQVILKLMIDGVASHPFSAMTLPPLAHPTGSAEKVIRISRERYSRKRELVEEKISRWSASETDEEDVGEEGETPVVGSGFSELKKLPSEKTKPQLPSARPIPLIENHEPQKKNDIKPAVAERRDTKRSEDYEKKTISLSDLKPRDTARPHTPLLPHQNNSNEKNTSLQSTPITTGTQTVGAELTPSKKRRRRRRKKNREGGERVMDGGQSSTFENAPPPNTRQPFEASRRPEAIPDAPVQVETVPRPVVPQSPKQAPVVPPAPKKLNEDEEISFDDLV